MWLVVASRRRWRAPTKKARPKNLLPEEGIFPKKFEIGRPLKFTNLIFVQEYGGFEN